MQANSSKTKILFFYLLLVLSVMICIELGLRYLVTEPFINALIFKIPNENIEPLWMLRWYHNPDGTFAKDRLFEFDPFLGWKMKANIRDENAFGPGRAVYTNAIGIRSEKEFAPNPTDGKYRIAVIGDSFSFSQEVSNQQSWAELLQKKLLNVEVLNFSVMGYGEDQIYLRLQRDVSRFHPNLVILGFMDADVIRNSEYFRDYYKPKFNVKKNNELELQTAHIVVPQELRKMQTRSSRLLDWGKIIFKVAADALNLRKETKSEYLTPLSLELIKRTVDCAKEMNAEIIISHLPGCRECTEARENFFELFVLPYCNANGVLCHNPLSEIVQAAKFGPPYDTVHYGHWDPLKNRVFADSLAAFIDKNKNRLGKEKTALR